MLTLKRVLIVLLAVTITVAGTGITAQPAQAAPCTAFHYVKYGETLYWIGRYYGVSWTYLASINGLVNPSLIFAGQKLCVSTSGGVPPTPYTGGSGWSFWVVNVVQDTSFTIRAVNMPDNVMFDVSVGRLVGGVYEWKKVADLDSDRGGAFNQTYAIPVEFAGTANLVARLTQVKKSLAKTASFWNAPGSSGSGGLIWPYYWGIPTIWIAAVVKDASVTINGYNFPPGLVFDVLMGPYGTRGIGGYVVGTLNSGAGGSLSATFPIPPQLAGSYRIAIRTQNLSSGFYSYNWFYNNTTY